eukprot:g60662.t1
MVDKICMDRYLDNEEVVTDDGVLVEIEDEGCLLRVEGHQHHLHRLDPHLDIPLEDGKGGTRKLDETQARNLIAEGKNLFASFFVFTVFQQGLRFTHWEVDMCLELNHRGLSREGIDVLSSAGRILPLRSCDLHRTKRLETVMERISLCFKIRTWRFFKKSPDKNCILHC